MIQGTVEILIDDDGLSVEELASACAVTCEWIERHVEGGLIEVASAETMRFTSAQLLRARRPGGRPDRGSRTAAPGPLIGIGV